MFPVVYTIGQERTSGLHGVMILAALPIFTGLYAAAVARRRPARGWLVGCLIALAGEVLLIGARGGGAGDATLVGDLLVLAAALVVSAGYVAGALLPPRGVSSVAATFWGVVLGAIVLSPLAAALLARDGLPEAGWKAWGAVAVLAVVTSVVGYIGWYWALDRGGIARISTVQFLQPLSGFALAVVVLGDSVTPVIAVGAAAILCGIVDRAARVTPRFGPARRLRSPRDHPARPRSRRRPRAVRACRGRSSAARAASRSSRTTPTRGSTTQGSRRRSRRRLGRPPP